MNGRATGVSGGKVVGIRLSFKVKRIPLHPNVNATFPSLLLDHNYQLVKSHVPRGINIKSVKCRPSQGKLGARAFRSPAIKQDVSAREGLLGGGFFQLLTIWTDLGWGMQSWLRDWSFSPASGRKPSAVGAKGASAGKEAGAAGGWRLSQVRKTPWLEASLRARNKGNFAEGLSGAGDCRVLLRPGKVRPQGSDLDDQALSGTTGWCDSPPF